MDSPNSLKPLETPPPFLVRASHKNGESSRGNLSSDFAGAYILHRGKESTKITAGKKIHASSRRGSVDEKVNLRLVRRKSHLPRYTGMGGVDESDGVHKSPHLPLHAKCSRELALVRAICNFDEAIALNRSENGDPKVILEDLHKENLLVFREASLGFRAVMSTKAFIRALQEHFEEVEGLPEAERTQRETYCILVFQDWLSFSDFYIDDFRDSNTLDAIEALINCWENRFGESFFNKLRARIKEIARNAQKVNLDSDRTEVGTFAEFLQFWDNNIEGLAKELFQLSINLQSRIRADAFDKSGLKEIRDLISSVNNNLIKNIVRDILGEECKSAEKGNGSPHKDVHVSNKNRARSVSRYKFYVKLSKIAQKMGDLFTCMALFGVFLNEEITRFFAGDVEVKKCSGDVDALIFFAGFKEGAAARNALLRDKKIPINFTDLFAKYEELREMFPPIEIEGEEGKHEIVNANYVAAISLIAADIIERQRANLGETAKTNLLDILQDHYSF